MVNKFGDDTSYPQGFGIAVQIVKKVTITEGKFVDYCSKIIATYRLGFTPYRLTPQVSIPVYTYDGKVFSHGSKCCEEEVHRGSFQHVRTVDSHIGQVCATETITDKPVTKDDTLVVFERADIDDEGAHVAAIQGDEGETGAEGPRGPLGPHGPTGPIGPIGSKGDDPDYGYVEIIVARMLPTLFKPDQIVNNLRMHKAKCWFRIRNKRELVIVGGGRNEVSKWQNDAKQGMASPDAVHSSTEMARCCDEGEKIKDRWFLKFIKSAQYKVDLALTPICCIFVVYRLSATSSPTGRYLMGCNETNKVKPKHPAIEFKAKSLNVPNGKGGSIKFDTFRKTNPLTPSVWHVLCVEWFHQGRKVYEKMSSVWVNAKKCGSFACYMINPTQRFVIGGMTTKDVETWWQGDIAHFEVYSSKLADYEKYFIQRDLCTTYGITADD